MKKTDDTHSNVNEYEEQNIVFSMILHIWNYRIGKTVYCDQNSLVVTQGHVLVGLIVCGWERCFWMMKVKCFDCSGDYVSIYICENLLFYNLKNETFSSLLNT